jgi:hypothetical protein
MIGNQLNVRLYKKPTGSSSLRAEDEVFDEKVSCKREEKVWTHSFSDLILV